MKLPVAQQCLVWTALFSQVQNTVCCSVVAQDIILPQLCILTLLALLAGLYLWLPPYSTDNTALSLH